MKSLPIVFLVSVISILATCGGHADRRLCGTWRMISGKYSGPDFEIRENDATRMCYKILSENSFAVIELYPNNPDSLFFAAFGHYEMSDTGYTEIYEASNVPSKIGSRLHFHSRFKDKEWKISLKTAELSLDETWMRISRPEIEE